MRRPFGFAVAFVFCIVMYGDEPLAPQLGRSAQRPHFYPEPFLRNASSALAPALVAILPPTSDEDIAAVRQWNVANRVPMRAGVVHSLTTPSRVRSTGPSAADAGAHWRWRGRVDVEGAAQLRIQMSNVVAPPDAVFWVYGDEGDALGFDVGLAHEGIIWTPSVQGSSITLEAEATGRSEIAFDVTAVAEIFDKQLIEPTANECLKDSMCSNLGDLRTSIGLMYYIKNGQPYICSGGLMNERRSTFIPYFLTANHCISTAAEAASLEVYWDYDTPYCGAPLPPVTGRPRSTGSSLLTTSPSSDVTLLKLNAVPPGYRWYMGWDPNPVPAGTTLRRISHPNGWPHAYSESIVTTTAGACSGWGRPNFIYSYNSWGSTAGGSSGSPVFYGNGFVVGQLTGSCGLDVENPCSLYSNRVDGSLSVSWPLLKPYLDPAVSPACTQNSTTACLLNSRFKVTINYRNQFATPPRNGDFAGQRLNASATNPDTAIFGFDNPQNVEVVVRVVDARPFAPRFDIYYGGLTDVEYWVNVTDTQTNRTKQYRNLAGSVGGGVDRATFPTQ